jgi:hypothetical protein
VDSGPTVWIGKDKGKKENIITRENFEENERGSHNPSTKNNILQYIAPNVTLEIIIIIIIIIIKHIF